ncbi:MAG: hypothetical protein JXR37_28680 [Kiritimatiellae bacterium]|nr:hypothetical protein [Kiritimatiellia bacterium]
MNGWTACLFVLALLVGMAMAARGETYFVAATGDDAGPGTEAQPWRTLKKAAASVAPGATGATPARWAAVEQPDLAQRLEAAPALRPEELCVPVRSARVEYTHLVPNPDGRTYDVVQFYCKSYWESNHVYMVDLGTGAVKHERIPDGRCFHLCGRVHGRDGKFYFALLAPRGEKSGIEVYVYDPGPDTLSLLGLAAVGLGVSAESNTLRLGTDGKLYGGGAVRGARVTAYQVDTGTGRITDYGALGPRHKAGRAWCGGIAADDEWLYVASGKVPHYLVAFNRKTREERVLLETDPIKGRLGVSQRADGCTARATAVLGRATPENAYWLYQGRAIAKTGDTPPWPARPAVPEPAKAPRPKIHHESLEPDTDGHAALCFLPAEARADAPPRVADDPPSEANGWKRVPLRVDTYPMPVNRLIEWPDGRLFGTAGAYLGNFLFDPATGRAEHLGKLYLSHGPTALMNGKAYLAGYSGSMLFEYDPAKPWTVRGRRVAKRPADNPRLLVALHEWTRTSMTYAAVPGADGKLYMAGEVRRTGHGGGFGWWDPRTQTAGGFWEPFLHNPIFRMVGADGARFMVISTQDRGAPARLFVYDVMQKKLMREIVPVPGAKSTGPIVEAMPGRILGGAPDPAREGAGILYGVDIRTGEVFFRKPIPAAVPDEIDVWTRQRLKGRGDFRRGPDGRVWTYIGKTLVRIDPQTVEIEVLGTVKEPGVLAFAGNDVYLGGTETLRRLRGLAGRAR